MILRALCSSQSIGEGRMAYRQDHIEPFVLHIPLNLMNPEVV